MEKGKGECETKDCEDSGRGGGGRGGVDKEKQLRVLEKKLWGNADWEHPGR